MLRNVEKTRSSRSQKRSERGRETLTVHRFRYPFPEKLGPQLVEKLGPPSMPRADLGTALPNRQEPTCYEMLRFPALFKSLARHIFVAS
jgi:hypothetical protein